MTGSRDRPDSVFREWAGCLRRRGWIGPEPRKAGIPPSVATPAVEGVLPACGSRLPWVEWKKPCPNAFTLPETKEKRYPRRGTKDDEGTRRGWRRLKRYPPRNGQGQRVSIKGAKASVYWVQDESAKGLRRVGEDSKGAREGPPVKTGVDVLKGSSHHRASPLPAPQLSGFLSCSSCISMFPHATNRFNGTWAYSR